MVRRAITLLALLLLYGPAMAQSPGGDLRPLRFAGDASIASEPPFGVHIEITRAGERATGTLSTDDLSVPFEGRFKGNALHADFALGESKEMLDLTVTPQRVSGKFTFAGQTGLLSATATSRTASNYFRPKQRTDLTLAEWRADLDELERILTTRHGGPFAYISRSQLKKRFADARRKLSATDYASNALIFRKLGAAIGDGHTGVDFISGRPLYPAEFAWFEDGIRLIAGPPEVRPLLGARLVSVNDTSTADLVQKLRPYLGQHETEWGYRAAAPILLRRLDVLRDAKIAAGPKARFRFADTTGEQEVTLEAGPARKDIVRYGLGAPLWERRPKESFFSETLPDGSVYLNWRAYDDLSAKSAALLAKLDAQRPRRLIIDMRDNGGGDFNVGRAFIEEVRKRPWLNQKDRLFVLIGRTTFSAAMTSAVDFKLKTNATLVGEPAGAKPNGWQEVRRYMLPNSGLGVRVSTRNYQFLPGRTLVAPDVSAPPLLDDWTTEFDSAVKRIIGK